MSDRQSNVGICSYGVMSVRGTYQLHKIPNTVQALSTAVVRVDGAVEFR